LLNLSLYVPQHSSPSLQLLDFMLLHLHT
jgi:hypothetical protein